MNTKKLSTIILGSALVLGLGASTGSFAQQQAQKIVLGEAAALIGQSKALTASANAIVGTYTGSAAQVALLEKLANDPSSAQGQQFAALFQQEAISGESIYHAKGTASQSRLARLRVGAMAMATKLGLTKANVQKIGAAIGGPIGRKVIGNSAEQCLTKWSDPTAQKSAVGVFLAMGQVDSVAAFNNQAVKNVQANFQGESFEEVQARVSAAMNSAQCDIARVNGLRAARQ